MNRFIEFGLKAIGVIVAAAVAFCAGFYAGLGYCERYVMPELIQKYPHEGQLGLEMMAYGSVGGLCFAVAVLAIGAVWIAKTADRSHLKRDERSTSGDLINA